MFLQPVDTQDDRVPMDLCNMESNILVVILNRHADVSEVGDRTRLASMSIRHIERNGMAQERLGETMFDNEVGVNE